MDRGSSNRKDSRGFTLVELLIVIAIIALLIGILLPGLGQARKLARKVVCASGSQQYAAAQQGYITDFRDRLPTYTWRGGVIYNQADPDLRYASSDSQATMNQATHILRTRADYSRTDLRQLTARFPQRRYTHLIINDYLSQRLPEPTMACPEDKPLKNWQRDPKGQLDPEPQRGGGTIPPDVWQKFWPYSSSYQTVPCAWSEDQIQGGRTTVTQYPGDHNLFWVGAQPLGQRGAWDIMFPAFKVAVFEFHDMHSSKFGIYHAYEQASAALVFWDGSVRFERTEDGNQGFRPDSPTVAAPTSYWYNPSYYGFEPPPLSGAVQDRVLGHYRWTRGGLKGIDFGAGEVDTGQPF